MSATSRPVIKALVRLRHPVSRKGFTTDGPIRILVDSGASTSVVPKTAIDILQDKSQKVRSKKVLVSTVKGTHPLLRTSKVSVCVDRVCADVPLLASRDTLAVDMILGADFLKKAKCSINFPGETVRCGTRTFRIERER